MQPARPRTDATAGLLLGTIPAFRNAPNHEDDAMNAIQMLKQDHKTVRGLLADLESTTRRGAKKRATLLARLAQEIDVHTRIEEEIFYPAFKEAGDSSDDAKLYHEAREEHRAAGEMVLPDLLKTAPDSEEFGGRAKVLKELIEHHAQEEEKEMFPRARQLFSAAELRELGERMLERKQALLAGAGAGKALKRAGQGLVGAVASIVSSDEDDDAAERGLGGRSRGGAAARNGAGAGRSSTNQRSSATRARG
jgi:hemerythrin superfamily protein